MNVPPYAELHCVSNFSFLRGASHPEELVRHAGELGYAALALTDECSVAGAVRAHLEARGRGIQFIVGSEFRLECGLRFVALATDRAGYAALCALITTGRRAAAKGEYRLTRADLDNGLPGCLVLWLPGTPPEENQGRFIAKRFPGRAWIAVELRVGGRDRERVAELAGLGEHLDLSLTAAGGVRMHAPKRQPLADTLTAIRLGTTVAEAGYALDSNVERYLRSRERLARLYPEALLRETTRIAERCTFSLNELRYEYPDELVPGGETPASHLARLAWRGARRRWPAGVPEAVQRQVAHELQLIAELNYEPYFLTVHDIVGFARRRGILCQGRGSAANSAVCFCLGITEVDPARMSVLFERFVSRERDEPPDIDVDFEHERREEVIQYLYDRYGRERAALAATVITYRTRSAVRDVGKALGLDLDQVDRLAKAFQWWDGDGVEEARLEETGFDPANPVIRRLGRLVSQLLGFPRHLSQHVGGFVISRGPLHELVPVENAAMADRTVIQWDKDDLDALGLLKVDVLGLGMLTAVRKCFALLEQSRGRSLTLATVPPEDPKVYGMIQRADTVGVFQVESRAQMAMLPRLKPACYYDLVVEVALVRPGPIQGDMVHPYLARRMGREPVDYPSEAVRGVLERTLGVPIFQEQVMQLAVVAAGFSPGEADRLRRAMAAWKRQGGLEPFEERLKTGMRERGYSEDFARRIFNQIRGFGEYGFPESHAASFALLVYVSAWLKRHEPAAFLAAMLNSQPLGFYAPSQLVQDARRHGVAVRGVDARHSGYDCTLETGVGETAHPDRLRGGSQPAVRLGLRMARGLSVAGAERLVAARGQRPWRDVADLARRAHLDRRDLGALSAAGAFSGLAGHRHRANWAAAGVEQTTPLLEEARIAEADPLLAAPTEGEDIVADYASLGLTLGRHPLALLRDRLARLGAGTAEDLAKGADGQRVKAAGLVLIRQRPGDAKGVTFVTIEDETGQLNVIVWPRLAEAQRRVLLEAGLMGVTGKLQRQDGVLHLVAERLHDHSRLLGRLLHRSRDFR